MRSVTLVQKNRHVVGLFRYWPRLNALKAMPNTRTPHNTEPSMPGHSRSSRFQRKGRKCGSRYQLSVTK